MLHCNSTAKQTNRVEVKMWAESQLAILDWNDVKDMPAYWCQKICTHLIKISFNFIRRATAGISSVYPWVWMTEICTSLLALRAKNFCLINNSSKRQPNSRQSGFSSQSSNCSAHPFEHPGEFQHNWNGCCNNHCRPQYLNIDIHRHIFHHLTRPPPASFKQKNGVMNPYEMFYPSKFMVGLNNLNNNSSNKKKLGKN